MTFKEALDIQIGPGRSVMVSMDETGDAKITWDRSNPVEVAAARAAFERARSDGYMAYKVRDEKAEVMHEFDGQAERVILAPPLKGGRA